MPAHVLNVYNEAAALQQQSFFWMLVDALHYTSPYTLRQAAASIRQRWAPKRIERDYPSDDMIEAELALMGISYNKVVIDA